jgi:Cdc6-like AAA superfamily ATPase
MKIVELEKPKLPSIHMLCDDIIDKKLEIYPAIKTCFGTSSTTILSGGTGSGKTTFVLQLMKKIFKKVYHQVILMMPENSYRSISEEDNIFKKYLEPENIYHEYSPDVLAEITEKIDECAADGCYTLLIIDDYGSQLKSKQEAKQLQSLFLKNRHLRLSVFLLCQNFYQCPKIVREIANNAIIFNTNKSQNLKFYEEMFSGKKADFDELMKMMTTTHDYLLCSLKHKKLYYNWNEIIFES